MLLSVTSNARWLLVHACIPYCRPKRGEHTELVYGTDKAEENLQYVVLSWRGGELIRFAEEPNAPPTTDTGELKPYAKA